LLPNTGFRTGLPPNTSSRKLLAEAANVPSRTTRLDVVPHDDVKITKLVVDQRLHSWKLHEANYRKTGNLRDLVLWQIRFGEHPNPADLAAALKQQPPSPTAGGRSQQAINAEEATLKSYTSHYYVEGHPKSKKVVSASRDWDEERRVAIAYFTALERHRRAREVDSRHPKKTAGEIKDEVAAQFGIGRRTLESIVKGMSATFK
jgi:hypothetical protein